VQAANRKAKQPQRRSPRQSSEERSGDHSPGNQNITQCHCQSDVRTAPGRHRRKLSAEGYAPIVADAGNASSQQISFLETLLSQRVDELIVATDEQDDELVGFCIRRGLPVILVKRSEARDLFRAFAGNHTLSPLVEDASVG
jgi:hypothetical protein